MNDEVLGHLVHFKKNGEPGEPYPLYIGETTFGTDPDADVRLKKKDVSLEPIHCVIHVNNSGTASLINKSDNNPVKINGVVIRKEQAIKDYDLFEIGNKKFQYSKVTPKSEKKGVQNTPSHKRYTMFTSSAAKVTPRQGSNNAKNPRGMRTPIVAKVMRSANKSARKSIVGLKVSTNQNTSFEAQHFDNYDVKPDTRDPSVERPKTTSKIMTRRMLGSPAPLRRRLSLTMDKIHVSKSPKATVSSRNLLLGDHLITPKVDKSLKMMTSIAKRSSKSNSEFTKTPKTPKNTHNAKTPNLQKPKNTPKSNKKLVTPLTSLAKTPKSSTKLKLPPQSVNRIRVELTEMADENLISFDSPMMHDKRNLSGRSKNNTPMTLSKTPKKNSLAKTSVSATKISKKTPKSARRSSHQNISGILAHLIDKESDKDLSPVNLLQTSHVDTANGSNVATEHVGNLSHVNDRCDTSSSSLKKLSNEEDVSENLQNRSTRRSQLEEDIARKSFAANRLSQSPNIVNTEEISNVHEHESSMCSRRSSVRISGVAKIGEEVNVETPLPVNRQRRSNRFSIRTSKEESLQDTDKNLTNISSHTPDKNMSCGTEEKRDSKELIHNVSNISNKSPFKSIANDAAETKIDNSVVSARCSLRKSNVENIYDRTTEQFDRDITRRSKRSSLFTSHVEYNDDIPPAEMSVTNQSTDSNMSGLHKLIMESPEAINPELSKSNTSRRSNRSSLHKSRVSVINDELYENTNSEKLNTPNTDSRSHRSSLYQIKHQEYTQQEGTSSRNTSQRLSEAKKSSQANTSTSSLHELFAEQGGEGGSSLDKMSRNSEALLHSSHVSHNDLDESMRNASKADLNLTEMSAANTSKRSIRSSIHNAYTSDPGKNLARENISAAYKNCSNEASLDGSYTDSVESSVADGPSMRNTSKRNSRSLLLDSHIDDQDRSSAEHIQSEDNTSRHSHRLRLSAAESNAKNTSRLSNQLLKYNSHTESRISNIYSEEFATTNTSRLSNRSSLYKSEVEHENIDTFAGNKSRRSSRLSVNKEHISYLNDSDIENSKNHVSEIELSKCNKNAEDALLTNTSTYSTRLSAGKSHNKSREEKDMQNVSRLSSRTPNVSSHNQLSISNVDPLDLPSEAVQTPNLLSSSQYSMISEASTRSSGRVKKTPIKFKDSICSFTSNTSGRKTPRSKIAVDDSADGVLTPNVKDRELMFDGTASSTPHHGRLTRSQTATPGSGIKHNKSVSFVESTPIPKQARQAYRSSSVQILNDSDIPKDSERAVHEESRSYSVISIMDDPTVDGVDPLEMKWNKSVSNISNISGRCTRSRSKLNMPASPLDSLIVNVDSDADLPTGSFHKHSETPSVSSSIKNNSSLVNESANFTTPENNISVIELSDDCLTPNSHLKRPKSKSMVQIPDQVVAYGTPKNTNQYDEEFKTPLNTPALFESLKKSVVRSRKRLNNSTSLREENVNNSGDEMSSVSSDISEANIFGETSLGQLLTDEQDVPVVGIKRGRESSGSILRSAKKKKIVHRDENQPIQSLSFDTSSEMLSEGFLNASTESSSSIYDIQNARNNRGYSKFNRSCSSLIEAKPKRSITRRSLQNVNICEYEDPALQDKPGFDDHVSSVSSTSTSEDLPAYLSDHASSDTSRHTKSLSSPYSDRKNSISGEKSTPKSPLNDLTDVRGARNLMKTPRQIKSPYNDLGHVRGVRNLMKTPREIKSPRNDLTDVRGVKIIMKTPRQIKSPRNDLRDVRGVKKLLKTPKLQHSPKNDLSDVRGVKRLVKTPRKQGSPRNDLTDVRGVKSLLRTPQVVKSPKNDLTAVQGIKKIFTTPGIQKSPKNDLTNVAGIKRLLRSPKVQMSPKNDLSDLRGVKHLYRSPRMRKEPCNDLTDVGGLKRMYLVEEAAAKRQSMNTSGIDVLFQTTENQSDIENLDLFSNIHRKPLRTYRGKSFSPRKASEDKAVLRKTLGDIPLNSPHVEKWVEQQIQYTQEKTERTMAELDKAKSLEAVVQPECSLKEVTGVKKSKKREPAAQDEPVSKSKRTNARKAHVAHESPKIVLKTKKLVVEIDRIEPDTVENDEIAQDVDDNVEQVPTIRTRKGTSAKSKTKERKVTKEEASLDANSTETNNAKEKTRSRRAQTSEEKSDNDKSKESASSNDEEPIPRHTRRRAVKIPIKTPEEKQLRTRRGRKAANEVPVVVIDESDTEEQATKVTRPRRAGKKLVVNILENSGVKVSDDEDNDSRTRSAKTVTSKRRGVKSVEEKVEDAPRLRKRRKAADNVSVKSFDEDSQLTASSDEPRRGRRRNNAETAIITSSIQDTADESSDNGRAKRIRKPTKKVEDSRTEVVEERKDDAEKPSRPVRLKRGQKILEQSTPITTPIRSTRKTSKKDVSESPEVEVAPKGGRRKALETTTEETPAKTTRTTRKKQIIDDKLETPKSPAKIGTQKNKKGKQVIKLDTETEDMIVEAVQPVKRTRRKVLENVDAMSQLEEKQNVKQKTIAEEQVIRKSTRTRKK